jgi:hypothetical protein
VADGYGRRLPSVRPRGLRLTSVRADWYRLDSTPPDAWTWTVYPTPMSRFDSAAGTTRVRYAGDAPRVALRERFDREERKVTARHLDLVLVELTGPLRVLDLRRDDILDALGLDDQISTSRAPDVWSTCHVLTDRVHTWFGERCDGLVYRSRTTPQRSANLAFFPHAPVAARSLGPLREQTALLSSCVLSEGFAVMGWR